jgi:peptide deformylase
LTRTTVVAFAPLRCNSAWTTSSRLVRSGRRTTPSEQPRSIKPASSRPRQEVAFASWVDYLFGRKMDEEELNSIAPPVKSSKTKILKYPHPKLRAENEVITEFGASLAKEAADLMQAMYDAEDGVGLAAPQVGLNKRLMVFNEMGDATKPEKEMVFINPSITASSKETDAREEGCLSFPQIYGKVIRHKWVDIEYQNVKGDKLKQRLEGWTARVFQHEYDHLDKVLLVDRIAEEDRKLNGKRLEKMLKKYGAGGAP